MIESERFVESLSDHSSMALVDGLMWWKPGGSNGNSGLFKECAAQRSRDENCVFAISSEVKQQLVVLIPAAEMTQCDCPLRLHCPLLHWRSARCPLRLPFGVVSSVYASSPTDDVRVAPDVEFVYEAYCRSFTTDRHKCDSPYPHLARQCLACSRHSRQTLLASY